MWTSPPPSGRWARRGGSHSSGSKAEPDVRLSANVMTRLSLLSSALGLSMLAACGTQSVIDRSRDYARLGDYKHAFEVLEDARRDAIVEGEPVDQQLALAHSAMYREFLRDRARRRIFQERIDGALRDLDELERIAPGFPEIKSLRQRARVKQARQIVAAGDEHLAQKEFPEAMAAYLESLRLAPGDELAEEGIVRVREQMERMNARAQQQFLEAVRKLPEFRTIEVQWHAENVLHSTPRERSAKDLREQARQANAKKIFEDGQACEQNNQFGAAAVMYKQAREIWPGLPGIDEAIARMNTEMDALGEVERAEILIRNGKFVEAREILEQAHEDSILSRGMISELLIEARKLEGERRYRAARDLEVMGNKAEALKAFEEVAKEWPDGVEDEGFRIEGLRADVKGAADAWAAAEKAEAAGDLVEALDHYVDAKRYYEKWRDYDTKIEELRKAIAAKEGSGSGSGSL